VDGRLKEMEQRHDFKRAIYGPNADLSDDDVMESNDLGAILARKMVEDLSQYIDFAE